MSTLAVPEEAIEPYELGSDYPTGPRGRLVALRTKAEVEASFATIDAYIAEIPIKTANKVLIAFDDALRTRDAVNLQHLRRFVKYAHLPTHLRSLHNGLPVDEDPGGESKTDRGVETIYFLVCAASSLSVNQVSSLLSSSIQYQTLIRTTIVPSLPPISSEQAAEWSHAYWPTIFKNTNPYGPHPSILSRAVRELGGQVDDYMSHAHVAAHAVVNILKGQNIGAAVVDRSNANDPRLVVIAGDARWHMPSAVAGFNSGNVLGHAVMRAIALVARKRLQIQKAPDGGDTAAFADEPLTEVERNVYDKGWLKPGGYLCLDLELYLTHEPCVMCSMAILHSRFGRVIFQYRMPKSGGLTADRYSDIEEGPLNGLGYGLFWRPELNWKLLAWQWLPNAPQSSEPCTADMHA